MSYRVFGEALNLIDGLRGIGVTDKFRVQITRVIRRLQREAEIVHGENIFQEFGFLEIADTARLPGGIELMSQRVRAGIEIVIVARLVDAHSPQNNGGMVPVAADHAAYIVDRDVLPVLIANVLPAGDLFEDQQADLVAGIEKMA